MSNRQSKSTREELNEIRRLPGSTLRAYEKRTKSRKRLSKT